MPLLSGSHVDTSIVVLQGFDAKGGQGAAGHDLMAGSAGDYSPFRHCI